MWFLRRRLNKTRSEEADEALKDAQANLKRVKRRGGEVTRLAESLREIRERNHFAEQMEEIITFHQGRAPE